MNFMSVAQLLGNIGEFVGAIGVIVTLVYLAIQVRSSGRAQMTATQHAILSEFRRTIDQVREDPKLFEANRRLMSDQVVPEESALELQFHLSNVFRIYEELYLAHRNRSIDESFWRSRRATLRDSYLNRTFVQSWWQSWGATSGFSDLFLNLVQELTDELEN